MKPSMTTEIMLYDGKRIVLKQARWGYTHPKGVVINARKETVFEKSMFKESVRCIILASGYYEFDQTHLKVDVFLPHHQKMYFAGVCRQVNDTLEYVVITTTPNDYIKTFHDRMPLILKQEKAMSWLMGEDLNEVLNTVTSNTQMLRDYQQVQLFEEDENE